MKRRNIRIDGKTFNERLEVFDDVKERLKERINDPQTLDRLVNFMLTTGWDVDDAKSVVKQGTNSHRPAVQAFLFNNEHSLDQVMLNQGTYTHFNDTASDPNYALRHPGQTELILRRLTPGDLLMLQASHALQINQGGVSLPSEQDPDYWQYLYRALLFTMTYDSPVPSNEKHWNYYRDALLDKPENAAATAINFCLSTRDGDGEKVSMPELTITFFDSKNRFYTGIHTPQVENVRSASEEREIFGRSSYCTMTTFPGSPTNENLWMTAFVLTCYGIDNEARDDLMEGRKRPPHRRVYYSFINYVRARGVTAARVERSITQEPEPTHNADTEAQEHTGPNVNRLLP